MKDFWNERYSEKEYVYGKKPNTYFQEKLDELRPGRILLPAEGEGRNAVYAARMDWEVFAFDISKEGKKKARKLAREYKVDFDYQVGKLEELDYKKEEFDAVALIFAHFPKDIREHYFQQFDKYLRPGGVVIFEGFSREQIEFQKQNPQSGGPKDAEMLYTKEELEAAFSGYKFEEFEELEVELEEGEYHKGKAAVIRFLARKA
ncbi:class I SAM-dependent methyltransferase [Salegentibacter sediminis]|uniref:class I SAM-dependent methyltransferase n=1 Tax=Salegentibacter sediminis TaxID=1930251 RepID=UPI0009BCCF96|nr:class I SAM-dependent methyltransferase [Salegentibacter sediminis]